MDTNINQNNLKTLKEMILDEQKLVTYISLTKDLCIHVNEGKSLLCYLVKDIRRNNPDTSIYVSYIISGMLNNNSAATIVCSEADIDSLRSTFNIIFYEHVYSVSQGLKSVDNVAFAAVSKFEDLPLCTGLIKSDYCTRRSENEIGNLKSNSKISITESKSTILKVTKVNNKEPAKNGHEDVKKVHETKSEPNIKTEVVSPKKDTTNNSKTINKKNGKVATKNIAGFFNKANSVPAIKTSKSHKDSMNDVTVESEAVKDMKIKIEKVEDVKKEKKTSIKSEPMDLEDSDTKSIKEPKTKGKPKGSLSQIKKNAKVDKKRKRVLHVSDSESDHETNDPFAEEVVDHDSEDEIPPTPTVSTVKITSGIVNPKKRRKVVDKTYTDEEGYILTKKEEVYESCSDNEEGASKENVDNKKVDSKNTIVEKVPQTKSPSPSPKKKGKKKVSPPQKGKQPTMMSFFKKV